MIVRIFFLLVVILVVPTVPWARGVEHVTLRRDGTLTQVLGRLEVEAQDGGLLLLAPDGVLWTVEPHELVRRQSDQTPFQPLSRQELGRLLQQELSEGFQLHDTAHYLICYNTSKAYARWCGALYERLYGAFLNYWNQRGIPLSDPPAPLVALVFNDKHSYVAYARGELGDAAESIVGYYSLRTNRMTMFDLTGVEQIPLPDGTIGTSARINQILSQPNALPAVATVVHEATHQLAFNCGLHRRYADIPLWVSEGTAIYFETPDLTSAQGWRGIGMVHYGRLARFGEYLRERPRDSLRTLVADDRRLRDPRQALDAYAEAWALCHFLLRRHPQRFHQYLKELAQKEPLLYDTPEDRWRLFRQYFGPDLERLDADLLRYIARLR
jgi:hypothetical protein